MTWRPSRQTQQLVRRYAREIVRAIARGERTIVLDGVCYDLERVYRQ